MSRQWINQSEIKEYYELGIRFGNLEAKLMNLMIKGAPQQEGEYRLTLRNTNIRRVAWKEYYIDLKGEAAAERILENTPAKTYRHLRVKGRNQ